VVSGTNDNIAESQVVNTEVGNVEEEEEKNQTCSKEKEEEEIVKVLKEQDTPQARLARMRYVSPSPNYAV
jgi:hypothetical protein